MSAEAYVTAPSGTGTRVGRAVVTLAGVAALIATLTTCVSIWLQAKNYRKPLLQRYVIRILLMVPIYSAASWASLISLRAAFWIDPFRDVYEAFTIYTFFQLLINFIGGERALIILMYGRRPVSHLWPLNYVLPKVDISDPHTFLAIKRGILQYTWMKPLLAVATIIMKATNTYQEGYIGLRSGYFWSGLIYNISITISLYALAMFWVIMADDMRPFRPMPKFLCVKGIIFASYWQGFFLSILVWLGAIPDDVPGYTPDNLAASIQDALICFEMPFFAFAHWYAFSWHDYADVTISAARMPVKYALRDAFGPVDLIQDTKLTFGGGDYDYRSYDAKDHVLAHEDSSTRTARMMAGMRYERGGKGKYWIPRVEHHHRTPLLGSSKARTMSPGVGHSTRSYDRDYGTTDGDVDIVLDAEEEKLYESARALEFGDWNYPVITAHTANRESILHRDPTIITASTNRHVLQPTKTNKTRRKSRIQSIQEETQGRRHRSSSSTSTSKDSKGKDKKENSSRPLLGRASHSSSSSSKSDRSQLVDLVVEDHEAEQIERVRARKEGSPAWNEAEPKHFVRTYPDDSQEEEVQEGFEPDKHAYKQPHGDEHVHNLDRPFSVNQNPDATGGESFEGSRRSNDENQWTHRAFQHDFSDERNAWSGER
ncbi:uncharacterized protein PV09_00861 [Verruconis gallopava]|uniref:DUF300-domain-containing protein n=1 Tax=Verruconis gallopava TaxID=253628 RepID=A0A0D1Z7L5_9PEZI|nr:uncharacterized protein PV09_00861 [Verruconis gallopava]KIW08947.1 hypothetical protein PV09_00861 [Verruconis gallopava]